MKTSHKALAWLAGAILVLVVWASFQVYTQLAQSAAERKHTFLALNMADDFMSDLKDAETSERGYLLTGDAAFLKPYLAVKDTLNSQLEGLRQFTLVSDARSHLVAIAPLLADKLAFIAHSIERRGITPIPVSLEQGKRLMDSIRVEMKHYLDIEELALTQHEAAFQSNMRLLLIAIVSACLLILLLALLFARSILKEAKLRIKNLVYKDTQHHLDIQNEINTQLQQAIATLQISEERLAVTLNSIGDAVIATDNQGRVTLMNPLAAKLTGWTCLEASGQDIAEIFHIINKDTRQLATIPVADTLAKGTVHGLANHTVLIPRTGHECDIADSCAPIRDREGRVVGAVLVFRDVSGEYSVQQTLREQHIELELQNEELRISKESLELTQARYFHLYDLAPVGYITVNEPGFIREANLGAAAILSMATLVKQALVSLILDADQDIYYLCCKQLEASNTAQECELRMLNSEGKPRWVQLSISAAIDNDQPVLHIVMVDIDDRKQIEAEQQKLDQRLRDLQFYTRSLIEANIDAIVTTDPAGIISDVNRQMEVLTGCTRDELIGAPVKNYFTDPEQAEAGFKRALSAKGINNYELVVRNRDGCETPVSYNASTFYDRNRNLLGVFAAARNISERKLIEQALQEKNLELERTRAVAEKASLAKSTFLSSMSHELRTPLNAILGFAQLLEVGSPTPTGPQVLRLQQIIKAGWYLLELINEILDLAVIESGKLVFSPEAVSLAEIMQECQNMIEPQAQKRGIQINYQPIDPDWYASADRVRLKQVLINLLSNAIKYNREHGTVEVKCSCTPLRLSISILDCGAGLSAEKLAQLFQPFNRLGQEAGIEEGTGIGLVVTKKLVELMGGAISVESSVGVGSEFVIELIRDLTPKLSYILSGKPAAQVSSNASRHTLLYVEDNPANLMLVEQIIEGLTQMIMLSACDGHQGVALARSHLPDVILMDINLTGISGVEALKVLQQDPKTAHIPIIALSANAMQRDIDKGLEAGFFRYLTKPIKIPELIKALDEALK